MTKRNVHCLAPFHTILSEEYAHCAFSGKALRLPKMLKLTTDEYNIIEYSNGKSESDADEHVVMLQEDEVPKVGENGFHGDHGVIGSPHWTLFNERLIAEMLKRVKPWDIICYTFGNTHSSLQTLFPQCFHVETGIGYPNPFSTWRVYESSAWMHYHYGKDQNAASNYYTVIPNYYDTDYWHYNPAPTRDYVLFLGRITHQKGLEIVSEVARYLPKVRFIICGQGDAKPWLDLKLPNIEYREPVKGKERYELVSNAACLICPTLFIEPFCGVHAEAQLCGVPVITSNRGVFWETVTNGKNGYVCATLGDYISGTVASWGLDREAIASDAKAAYSLESCGKKYVSYFRDLVNINNGQTNENGSSGWYLVGSNHHALPKFTEEHLRDVTIQ